MICAETFGCSGKAPFAETKQFAELAGLAQVGNFSSISGSNFIVSIDRVSRCAVDWKAFARIAISHASRDIEVGLATPSHALVCYEFGDDASAEDRATLVSSVRDAAKERGIALGKCHSAITGSDVTSLVIALVGETLAPRRVAASNGLIWINGPIGIAKLLYLEGLKHAPDQRLLADALATPLDLRRFGGLFSVMSDVSGHGLAGCLCDLAERHSLTIDVVLSAGAAASSDVFEIPTSLLENELDDYQSEMLVIADGAIRLSLLKETAGPVVALSGNLGQADFAKLQSLGWRKIGSYGSGPASVSIGWSE